jgi:hypothetical protein
MAGGIGVGGVGVVEQGRGEDRGEEDDEPEAREDEEGGGTAGGVGGEGKGEGLACDFLRDFFSKILVEARREGRSNHGLAALSGVSDK